MVVLAGLLAWSFVLEGPARELVAQGEAAHGRGEKPELNPEQRQIYGQFSRHWLITLLVLLAVISLAAVDFFAIRRYGQRHYRQIQADRRAMIEAELTRLRSER